MCRGRNLSHHWLHRASPISQRSQTQSAPALSWPQLPSPSLCFCHALKPLEGLLPAINVTILSRKINEPASEPNDNDLKSAAASSRAFYLSVMCVFFSSTGCSQDFWICENVFETCLFLSLCLHKRFVNEDLKRALLSAEWWFALLGASFVFLKRLISIMFFEEYKCYRWQRLCWMFSSPVWHRNASCTFSQFPTSIGKKIKIVYNRKHPIHCSRLIR